MAEEDSLLLALRVAFLKAEGFEQQIKIAEELDISQSQVSRLFAEVRRRNWISTRTVVERANVPKDLLEQYEAQYSVGNQLNKILERQRYACKAWICEGSTQLYRESAALVLRNLLKESAVCGVAWGSNLANVVDCVTPPRRRTKSQREFRCLPVSGEPMYVEHLSGVARYNSSAIAQQLQWRITGRKDHHGPTLHALPAYISSGTAASEEAIRDFVERSPGYDRIFGKGRLIDKVDTLLTGVGLVGPLDSTSTGTFVRERILQDRGFPTSGMKWASGDIAGILLPRSPTQSDSRLAEFNRRLLGITEPDLFRCAEQARTKNMPGVVIMTTGPAEGKANVIRIAIERGLVNHLILPRDIGEALRDELGETEGSTQSKKT